MSLILGLGWAIGLAAALAPETTRPASANNDARVAALADEVRNKGWIVYGARSKAGDWDLFVCRPDGSSVRNITNTAEFSEAAPRFSPDGKRLLYRRLPRDATIHHDQWGFQGQPVMANADGTDPKVIGQEGELPWACWSPDGKQVSCLTKTGILIVDLATTQIVRKLPRQGMYQQLMWSPDGKWFCGASNHFGEMWTVARMNVETGEINAVNEYQNCTPDWLGDSKRIIFSHRPKQEANKGYGWTQLYLADGDGKNRTLVYGEDGRHIYGGGTSPDAKYMVFTSCPDDGGGSEKDGAPTHVMRAADIPTIAGPSEALRKRYPNTKDGPVLVLPVGWEPHWTYADVGEGK